MRIAAFVAASMVILTGFLHAQSDDDEDDMSYFPLVPTGNSLRFGLRYVGGPKVAFHHLGDVPANVPVYGVSDVVARTYNDGKVNLDGRTDGNGYPKKDGWTNNWSVDFPSQINADDKTISFHIYSATPMADGQTIKGRTASASGWVLEVGRSLGKIGRKVDVSLVAGFSFSGINAKRTSEVQSDLNAIVDTFTIGNQGSPGAPYVAPTSDSAYVYDSNGQHALNSDGSWKTIQVDNSVLLGALVKRENVTDPNHIQVSGHWQIKGAYYTLRVGPVFQLPVTERIKLSIGFGAAAAFVGSTYSVDEEIIFDDIEGGRIKYVDAATRNLVLPLIYADGDAEYWLTERTGFYLGATYQRSKSFEETVGSHTATVDLGTTSGITSGLTLRF
jgi:hypothetical protein